MSHQPLHERIQLFVDNVEWYLSLEYDPFYATVFARESSKRKVFDFLGSYYLGGASVPDATRYLVEFIEQRLI